MHFYGIQVKIGGCCRRCSQESEDSTTGECICMDLRSVVLAAAFGYRHPSNLDRYTIPVDKLKVHLSGLGCR